MSLGLPPVFNSAKLHVNARSAMGSYICIAQSFWAYKIGLLPVAIKVTINVDFKKQSPLFFILKCLVY